jgi:hypothetical protein
MSIFDQMAPEEEKLRSAEDQSPDEKKLAAYIRQKVEEGRQASNRVAHEGQWMTNVAYLLGFDSVYYDTNSRQFVSINNSSRVGLRRNRVFENLILPAVQNRQARLCKQPPKFEVRPENSTSQAKDDARLGFKVLLQLWDDCEVNLKRLLLTMWLQECGHAYLKVGFDDQLGKPLFDPMNPEQVLGYEGQVTVDPVSAFEVFPDPLAQTLDDCQWIVQAKVRKLDYFKTRYPERGHLVKEENAWLLSVQYEQRINSLNSAGMASGNTQLSMENAAIELTLYEARTQKHPNGRFVVTASGVILEDKPLPVGEIPFAKFDDVLVAGKYYSEATITHARPLQDQYNATLSRRAQWVRRLLAGKYIAAKGHGLHPEALDDQSGEVVEYDHVEGAAEPHAIDTPTMPEYAYKETDDLKSSLYQIFGLSEVSRGQIPSAGIPAVGMQLLLEQDETRAGIEIEQHEHSYAKVGRLMLKYAHKFVKTPRNLYETDASNEITVREFSGDDLPGEPDVRVVRGSTVPTSTSNRRSEIINMFDRGLLGNPADPMVQEKVTSMLEFGETSALWEDSALDANQWKRIINTIESGEIPPPPDKGDNHPYLIKQLNNYRKSDKYLELDPAQQALIIEMREAHLDLMMQMTQPQVGQMEQNIDEGMSPDGIPLEDEAAPVEENLSLPQNDETGAIA